MGSWCDAVEQLTDNYLWNHIIKVQYTYAYFMEHRTRQKNQSVPWKILIVPDYLASVFALYKKLKLVSKNSKSKYVHKNSKWLALLFISNYLFSNFDLFDKNLDDITTCNSFFMAYLLNLEVLLKYISRSK